MHARITAYKGHLVLELLAKHSIVGEVVTTLDTPGNIGQVIMNSDRNLGVSPQALALLKQLKRGSDDLGDIDWFASSCGPTFGWTGGPFAIKKPDQVDAARSFGIFAHQVIDNRTAQGAKDTLDTLTGTPPEVGDDVPPATAATPPLKAAIALPTTSSKPAALLQRICREMELSRKELRLLQAALSPRT